MVSASAQVSVPRLDEEVLVGALAELIRRWRSSTFDVDGVLLHDGARVEGLRLLGGRHHQAGARYRIVVAPKRPELDREVVTLTIVAVEHDRLDVSLDLDGSGSMAFTVENPARPTRLTGSMDAAVPEDSPRFMHGPVRADAEVDLTAIPSPGAAQVVARVGHRRISASAEVSITQPDSRDWALRTTSRVRGGGLVRPLVAVASPFLRGRFEAELRKSMTALAVRIVALDLGAHTATELADRAFDEVVASLVGVVEPGE